MRAVLIACVCFFGVAAAVMAVDVSEPASSGDFSCLVGQGFTTTIVRCYMSTGSVDPNAVGTMQSAWDGGMSNVDGYIFPCFSCGNPQQQIQAAVDNLNGNVTWGTLWFDIEGPQYWGDQSDNANFFAGMVQQAQDMGVNIGVYTSASQWIPIMGGYQGGSSFPLWYANYDGNQNFNDFSAFGGWSSPTMKQYGGNCNKCGASVDVSWGPGGSDDRIMVADEWDSSSSGSGCGGSSSSSSGNHGTSSNSNSGSNNSGSNSGNNSGSNSNSGNNSGSNNSNSGSGNSGSNSGSHNSNSNNSNNSNNSGSTSTTTSARM